MKRNIFFPPEVQLAYDQAFALHARGLKKEAEQIYDAILRVEPEHYDSLHLSGVIAYENGRLDDAEKKIRDALKLKNDVPVFYNNLGNVLAAAGKIDAALFCYRQALKLDGHCVDALNNMGVILKDKGQPERALGYFERAVPLAPEKAEVLNNAVSVYMALARWDDAREILGKALSIDRQSPDIHWNFAFLHLVSGRFREGWEEAEWRTGLKNYASLKPSAPVWQGQDEPGRTIAVYCEQGLGDNIQFARFVPLLRKAFGTVHLICPPPLKKLFLCSDLADGVFLPEEQIPRPDFCISTLSLPFRLRTEADTFARTVPYLRTEEGKRTYWEEKLQAYGGQKKIGIVWRGNPNHVNDHNRSMKAGHFIRMLKGLKANVFIVQKDAARDELRQLDSISAVDLTEELKDFSDTACFIENMDLVLTVDTSVCHLTGALGVPVWTLLPYVPDWRWRLDRSESDWYPSMRLFRQPRLRDWDSVVDEARDSLQKWLESAV